MQPLPDRSGCFTLIIFLLGLLSGILLMSTHSTLSPDQKPYKPYGSAEEIFYAADPILGLHGPAGTGKSRAFLEKLHLLAEKYPNFRGLIVRKTRESLSEAALFTLEEKVIPVGHATLANQQRRNFRQSYLYPNGSEIVVGGLDKPQKMMSTEYDVIYIQEATECTENDIEMLSTRLRNGILRYQQLCFDCNPDKPRHWIWQRHLTNQLRLLQSHHEDNPTLFDPSTSTWTPAGVAYLSRLDKLTGPRLQRLRYGKWVTAEGAIYEQWDPATHLLDRSSLPSPIPADWPRWWVVDFGYVNPFVWQAWTADPDGALYRYAEIYKTQTLVEEHARAILKWQHDYNEPAPLSLICDHDAEDRHTLEKYLRLRTTPAHKAVSDGIQAVSLRLKPYQLEPGGPNRARLYLLRDSLIHPRDQVLIDTPGAPTGTEEEWDGYVWETTASLDTRNAKDQPRKKDDHGLDSTRYLVAHVDRLSELKGKDIPSATILRGLPVQAVSRQQRSSPIPARASSLTRGTSLRGRRIPSSVNEYERR